MKKESKKTTKDLIEEVSPIDQILDENNKDNIVLYNDKNEPFEFEQIAVIPLDEGETQKLYAILLPVTKIPGIADDEAVTFELNEEEGNICVCADDAIIDKVMVEYERLLDDSKE